MLWLGQNHDLPIIADSFRAFRLRGAGAAAAVAGLAAAVLGTLAALVYGPAGLSLSHYDAKAHLVVARRIFDSLTPGWVQIGAVWLPLPHLLNAVPVQVDVLYRTGAFAIAVSVLSFGVLAFATARLVHQLTGSPVAAMAGASILALNPNLLYLQATPMTEPMLLALTFMAAAETVRWIERGASARPRAAGLLLAGACLTRYEAWAVAPALAAAAAYALWREGRTTAEAARRAAALLVYPGLAFLGFLLLSRLTVGQWLVTGGFFTPTNPAAGRIGMVLVQLGGGLQLLAGTWVTSFALLAAAVLFVASLADRRRATLLVPLALVAAAALPAYAYFVGHPFRVRYMIPSVATAALVLGLVAGLLPRGRLPVAALLVGLAIVEMPPLAHDAALVREAEWNLRTGLERRVLTERLAREYGGEKILASMGATAHYMQEAAQAGFAIRDFIHEGNGEIWHAAIAHPARHAGWILMREEDGEGRDALARVVLRRPERLAGFERVVEAGSLTLYRRR